MINAPALHPKPNKGVVRALCFNLSSELPRSQKKSQIGDHRQQTEDGAAHCEDEMGIFIVARLNDLEVQQ